jgi:hypothetical protein
LGRFSEILILLLFTGLVLTSCEESDEPALKGTDLVALQGMEEAYIAAATHQDALLGAVDDADSVLVHRHDSLFHHYTDLFELHHSDYSHSNNHDDHRHGPNGMHMVGNGHMHDLWQDGHHEVEHDLMDDLLEQHD